jgi:hypothetical protein
MDILWHPDATRQIFAADGKPWVGGKGNRKLLLHSTETLGWPNYAAPPHLTLNPFTGELRQHVSFDQAAYALRDNAGEDDRYTWQIELIARAADTGGYDDTWYRNVADIIAWFHLEMGVPLVWADFSVMLYGTLAPQRMTRDECDSFAGIFGHAHFGRGVDSHWDPGRMDIERLARFTTERVEELDDSMQKIITDETWMYMFHSGVPGIVGFGRYYCQNDKTYDWIADPLEGLSAPWGSNPHPTAPDGKADADEKDNALNHLLQGFSIAAGTIT